MTPTNLKSNSRIHPLADIGEIIVGDETRIWQFVVILSGAKIGNNCNICSHCLIESDVTIGNNVTIKSGVQLWNGLRIGNNVFIGPNVTFTNDKAPRSGNRDFKQLYTIVEDNVSIGGGATILPGLILHKNSVIGAGAVVTRDVQEGTTVVGNPARPLNSKGTQLI